jgi:wyosine [tRNA(Phe)-imidazoG37] synthetase (radical SAM superfamily)
MDSIHLSLPARPASAISRREIQYLYGPVPSRRLGRSLGIDLVPFKTCTYDCIYCQLGRTTHKTLNRRDYSPIEQILIELEQVLNTGDRPDYISIAGSGEPTLHAGIGMLIDEIKKRTEIPVAVLTNGSMLWMPQVGDALATADVVLPSLDACNSQLFECINRPCRGIDFDRMVDGLVQFTHRFPGQVWLEMLLLSGWTDTPEAARRLSELVSRIEPARVQLNTVCRPPAEKHARSLSIEQMQALKRFFPEPVDIIGETAPQPVQERTFPAVREHDILALLARRPCTAEDVAAGLRLHVNEALKHLQRLVATEKAVVSFKNEKAFYACGQRHDH